MEIETWESFAMQKGDFYVVKKEAIIEFHLKKTT